MFGFGGLADEHCITCDDAIEDAFNTHVLDNQIMQFKRSSKGLCCCNLPDECIKQFKGKQHVAAAAEN